MPKAPTSPPDAPVLQELDHRFVGINERDDAGALESEDGGYAVAAVNVRFRTGEPETREGYVEPVPFHMQLFHGDSDEYYGAGTFTGIDGREWLAVVRRMENDPDEFIFESFFGRMGEAPRRVAAPTDVLASEEPVWLTQAGEEMILWRRDEEPMHWSGDWDDEWETATLATIPAEYPTYLQALPSAAFGIWAADRVWFPWDDGIGFTGRFEPRRWDRDGVDSVIRMGGAGPVTGAILWRQQVLIAFKETSVWAVNNATGDIEDMTLERITDQAGCIAQATVTGVGGDILWLGRGGVYRLQQVLDNVRQLSPVPVSWLIPKTMERINWAAAPRVACATLADGLWYLSVPVDGSLTNNAIFVYDTVTNQWQGEDDLAAYSSPEVRALARTTVFGRESPIVVAPLAIYAGGHGWHDGFGSGDIATSFTGRGYVMEEYGLKAVHSLEVVTEELGTEGVSLYAAVNGIRDIQSVQLDQDRDRAQYLTWGRADRDLSNAGDDFDEAYRNDYAWVVGETQVETATVSGTVTVAGNMEVTVTATGMTGSPLTTVVAVALGDTAAEVCAKMVTALRAVANITARFNVLSIVPNKFLLQRLIPAANDTALNISITNDGAAGITPAATSANTTAGSLTAEDVLSMGTNGVPLGYMQEHKLKGHVTSVARWLQPRLTTDCGRLRIKAVRATGRPREDVRAEL